MTRDYATEDKERQFQGYQDAFRQVLESAPDAVFVSDARGRIRLVNLMAENMFGLPREQLVGMTIEDLMPERFREAHAGHRSAYAADPYARFMGSGLELFALRGDGTEFPVEISLSPVRIGDELLVTSAVRDISERKRLERARHESEERLRALMDNTTAVVYLKDVNGRYLQVNRRFRELFHLDDEQILGSTDFDLFPRQLADIYWQHDRQVLESGAQLEFEEVARHDDGDHFYLSLKFPLKSHDGAPYAVCGLSTDITERKLMEASLERHAEDLARSNAELEQFAYVASHDLQEPLRMVASYAQLLDRRYHGQLDEDGREFLEYMVDGATRMQNLINDLLAYSRVGTRGKPFARTDLNHSLENVRASLKAMLAEAGADLEVDPLPTLAVDGSQMEQLFQNLVANGVKFRGDEPCSVRVAVEQELPDRFVFSVSDNGIGIDPQYGERIFLLFQRLHTQREYPGTGIGLAICKRIVERHGGRIWFESRPGEGTTFFFSVSKNLPTESDEEDAKS